MRGMEAEEKRAIMSTWRWLRVLAATSGLVIAVVLAWPLFTESVRAWALDREAAAVLSRPFAGRLHGVAYVPHAANRGKADENDLRLRAEAIRVLQTSASASLRGRALLLTGHAAAAADELERAARDGGAVAFSDLAAARVEEADELRSAEPALAGVVAARQAISAAPNLASAHFNLALALDRIGLTNESADAFAQAASLEVSSAWAAEALSRSHLEQETVRVAMNWTTAERRLRDTSNPATQHAIVASNVPMARRYAEGPYLIYWAEARVAGRYDVARTALAFARVVAAALSEVTGDRLCNDAVAAIDHAEAAGDSTAISLARAHLVYRDGRLARSRHDDARAISLLANAAEGLAAGNSPLQYVARYQIVGADYEQAHIDEALAQLSSIDSATLLTRGYRVLAAQLGWARGICLLVRGEYGEAFDLFDESHRLAVTTHDDDLAATLDSLAAQALEYLGDRDEASNRRARALRLNAVVHNDFRKAVTLAAAANSRLAARNWAVASALLDYALPLAQAARDSVVTAQVLAERSVARDELGDHVGAAHDRSAASLSARQVAALDVRNRLLGVVDIAEGVAHRNSSYFSRVIDQQKRTGQTSLLPRLFCERAHTRGAQNDRAGEISDLRAGLDVVAAWERSIRTPEQRAAVTVWGEAMRRDLIALELTERNVAAAFADADARPTRQSDALRTVRTALAPDAAVVEFVRTGDKLVAFVVRNDAAVALTLPASASRIAAAVRALRNARDTGFNSAAAELYGLVFASIRPHLERVGTIAFVPDHDLTGVSLGGMLDDRRGRYVAEDFIVVHAPTAMAAIQASRETLHRSGDSVVVLGASEFNHARYPDLEQLSNAVAEVRNISAIWRQPLLLTGAQVTMETVRRELPRASVIHFAGHIVGHGTNSRLVFGADGLPGREIARMPLKATRVVVLAACRGSASNDTPVMYADVGGAFLAAGVPVVIASANDVDDAEAPRTMVRLHRFLRDDDDAAAALRHTILFERMTEQRLPLSLRFLALGGTKWLVEQESRSRFDHFRTDRATSGEASEVIPYVVAH